MLKKQSFLRTKYKLTAWVEKFEGERLKRVKKYLPKEDISSYHWVRLMRLIKWDLVEQDTDVFNRFIRKYKKIAALTRQCRPLEEAKKSLKMKIAASKKGPLKEQFEWTKRELERALKWKKVRQEDAAALIAHAAALIAKANEMLPITKLMNETKI